MSSPSNNSELFHAVLNTINAGVIGTNENDIVVTFNPAAKTNLGITKKNALGTNIRTILHISDPVSEKHIQLPTVEQFRANFKPYYFRRVQIACVEKSKEVNTIVDLTVSPVKDNDDTIIGAVFLIRDLTEEIAIEREALNSQKLEAIGLMATNVANELDSWLSIIAGHASSISDRLIPNTLAHQESTKLIETTTHAGNLSKRLRSIARSRQSTSENDNYADLTIAIFEATSHVNDYLKSRNIDLKTKQIKHTPLVNADYEQLLDCVASLILNAIEATEDGGTISIDISEKSDTKKDFYVLRIRDNGKGIERKTVHEVFKPFFSTKTNGPNLGLGLTVARASAESWGGFIKLRSRIGQGTSVRVFIPKANNKALSEKDSSSGGETILIVDDMEKHLIEASNILTKAGYKILSTSSGKDCIKMTKENSEKISLIIFDMTIPGNDPNELLQNIRMINPSMPVIFTSGFSREYAHNCLGHNRCGFIQKPFDNTQMINTIRRTLNTSKTFSHGHSRNNKSDPSLVERTPLTYDQIQF